MQTDIPNDFTACETYRGFTIAVRGGWYSVFTEDGARYPEHYANRAAARRSIDGYAVTDPAPQQTA